MSSSSNTKSGGVGFCGMLTVLFIGLKLTHNIDWSWWWVLSPLWLPAAVIIGIWLVVMIVCFIGVCVVEAFHK